MTARPLRLIQALASYTQIAWWGLVAPRTPLERRALVVVQGVVLRDGGGGPEILLAVRSDLQGWEVPGGTPEPGEALEDALRRELHEETGLAVRVERRVGDYVRTGFRPHTARVYRCSAVGGTLRPSPETPRVRWFAVSALPDGLFPWYDAPIADALEADAAPVIRRERQGLAAIWAGLRIDLRMRMSEDLSH